jgi:DNA-binding protein HU-beta
MHKALQRRYAFINLSHKGGTKRTQAEIAEKAAKDAGISKVAAAAALSSFMGSVTKALKNKNGKVTSVGFGAFQKVRRKARKGRNPQTGAPETSLSGVIKGLRSHAHRGAPEGLVREASNACNIRVRCFFGSTSPTRYFPRSVRDEFSPPAHGLRFSGAARGNRAPLVFCSRPYLEILKSTAEIFPLDIKTVDTGDGRPLAAPIDEIVDRPRRTLEHRFHPTVGKVAHPPDDPTALGCLKGFPAEGDPLHPSRNQ